MSASHDPKLQTIQAKSASNPGSETAAMIAAKINRAGMTIP